jgi:hypothetical protein
MLQVIWFVQSKPRVRKAGKAQPFLTAFYHLNFPSRGYDESNGMPAALNRHALFLWGIAFRLWGTLTF